MYTTTTTAHDFSALRRKLTGAVTIPCPHCQREIYEEAERCPHCEHYLSQEEAFPPSRKPWWLIVGVLLCLYAVYRWITRGTRT